MLSKSLTTSRYREELGKAIGIRNEFQLNADFCYPDNACKGTRWSGNVHITVGKDGEGEINI